MKLIIFLSFLLMFILLAISFFSEIYYYGFKVDHLTFSFFLDHAIALTDINNIINLQFEKIFMNPAFLAIICLFALIFSSMKGLNPSGSGWKKYKNITEINDSCYAVRKDIVRSDIVQFDNGKGGIVIGSLLNPQLMVNAMAKMNKLQKSSKFTDKEAQRLRRSISSIYSKKNRVVLEKPLSVLCFAPPGTGKTSGYVIPTIFELGDNRSSIILDVKGELLDITSRDRGKHTKIMIFNPVKYSHRWNPLDWSIINQLSTTEVLTTIDRLLSVMIEMDDKNAGNYFELAGKEMVKITFMLAVLEGVISNSHRITVDNMLEAKKIIMLSYLDEEANPDINIDEFVNASDLQNDELNLALEGIDRFISDKSLYQNPSIARAAEISPTKANLSIYAKWLIEVASLNDEVKTDLAEFLSLLKSSVFKNANMPDDQFGGVLGTYDTKIAPYTNPAVKESLSANDIDFEDFFSNPTTLYLVISAEDLDAFAPLMRAFFESFAIYILSRKKQKNDYQVTLIIDEFPRLGKMQQILGMSALSRGQGVNIMIIAQSLGQIKQIYGNDAASTLVGTNALRIFFTQTEESSAEGASKEIGNTMYRSEDTRHDNGRRVKGSLSIKEGRLISATEIMSIPMGQHIAIAQNQAKRPMMLATNFWFMNDVWLARAGSVDLDHVLQGVPRGAERAQIENI